MKPNRLEVNEAIEKLIKAEVGCSDWKEWAAIIISYMTDAPTSSGISLTVSGQIPGGTSTTTGFTSEHGNVTIKEEGKDKRFEKEFGVRYERVGYFKISKNRKELVIWHFWKSDDATMTDEDEGPEEYSIQFDPDTLKPKAFGRREKTIFNFILFRLFRYRFVPIFKD